MTLTSALPLSPNGDPSIDQERGRESLCGKLPSTTDTTPPKRHSLQTASDKAAGTGTNTQSFELLLLRSKVKALEQSIWRLPTIWTALENIQHRLDLKATTN